MSAQYAVRCGDFASQALSLLRIRRLLWDSECPFSVADALASATPYRHFFSVLETWNAGHVFAVLGCWRRLCAAFGVLRM